MLKYLRITVTVLSLTACVLLIVLWVGSYWGLDSIVCHWVPQKYIMALSLLGEVGIAYGIDTDNNNPALTGRLDWKQSPHYPYSGINRGPYPLLAGRMPPFKARFRFHRARYHWYTGAPYWFLTMTTAALGAAPWIRPSRRFSLRTLLMAMTLVAVLLGLVLASI